MLRYYWAYDRDVVTMTGGDRYEITEADDWPCLLCGKKVTGQMMVITPWIGCWTCLDHLLGKRGVHGKVAGFYICHECASNIRNLCYKFEAESAARAREEGV